MKIIFRKIQLKKRYPLAISRCVISGSENLFVRVSRSGTTGLGELAASNAKDGETAESGKAALNELADSHDLTRLSISEIDHAARASGVPPRAHAALDTALWDQLAKRASLPLHMLLGLPLPKVETSVTVGINPPGKIKEMVPEILSRTGCRNLKIKLGSREGIDADKAAFCAARQAAARFSASLRVDANGGWSVDGALHMMQWLAARGADYIEQPLDADHDAELAVLYNQRPLPIFVDESCWTSRDIPRLAPVVDGVNVKLMKCGGITEALRMAAVARAHKLKLMIGCMGESSVAIAAGAAISSLFDYIDLDSHLNLIEDPATGLQLDKGIVKPSEMPGLGVALSAE